MSKILNIPINSNPSSIIDNGYDTQTLNYAIAPNEDIKYESPLLNNRKYDNTQYCNILPSAPRDQTLNVPYLGKNCNTKPNYYNKDRCYLVGQGVPGIICDQAGGSNNSNYVRGNQFGLDYPNKYNIFDNKKALEYTIENPVQMYLETQNPTIIYDKNTFYPMPTWNDGINKDKNYLTYSLNNNYNENGIPTYVYPYKIINPNKIYENFGMKSTILDIYNPNRIVFRIFLFIIIILILTFIYKLYKH